MEWFGITTYGVSDPIRDMMKPQYVEPVVPRDLFEVYAENKGKRSFADLIREIDIYIGQADGYAYKSYDRLFRSRQKGNFKPVGPFDMYRRAGCTSMEVGQFYADPTLKDATWHLTYNKYI